LYLIPYELIRQYFLPCWSVLYAIFEICSFAIFSYNLTIFQQKKKINMRIFCDNSQKYLLKFLNSYLDLSVIVHKKFMRVWSLP
jgi:hypothetical protein